MFFILSFCTFFPTFFYRTPYKFTRNAFVCVRDPFFFLHSFSLNLFRFFCAAIVVVHVDSNNNNETSINNISMQPVTCHDCCRSQRLLPYRIWQNLMIGSWKINSPGKKNEKKRIKGENEGGEGNKNRIMRWRNEV